MLAGRNSIHEICLKLKFFKKSTVRQPKIRYRYVVPIYPPPGLNLKIPGLISFSLLDWTPHDFLNRIGNNCVEIADKFENINEIIDSSSVYNSYELETIEGERSTTR